MSRKHQQSIGRNFKAKRNSVSNTAVSALFAVVGFLIVLLVFVVVLVIIAR